MSTITQTLQARLTEVEAEQGKIKNAIETEQRVMSPEELDGLEKLNTEHASITRQLSALNASDAAKAEAARPQPAVRDLVRPAMSITQFGNKDNGGFRSTTEFYNSVKAASLGRVDNRLVAAATTYGSEGTQADGGFAVPNDLRRDIWSYVVGNDALLPLTDQYSSFSNVLTFPADTQQPWAANLTATWTGEGAAIAESKNSLGQVSVTAYKLPVAVNMTDELLQDAVAAGSYVTRKAGERINEVLNAAFTFGNGTGQPKGALSGAHVLVQPSGSGQAAATITRDNIYGMYFKMPAQDRKDAVWMISPSAEPALHTGLNSGSIGPYPVFMPAGTIAGQPYGTILGRPYIVNGNMKALGAQGDFAFVNWKRYLTLVKTPGIQQDVSIHVYFLQDISTYRFIVRIGGTPWVTSPVTLQDGSTKVSPYVVLASR